MSILFATDVTPLSAEKLFNIGPLPFTNSMLFGLAAAFFTIAILGLAAGMSHLYPKSKLSFWIESLVEFILDTAISSFGDRKKALKHLPFLATLFCFIFVCNISGLLPGVDTVLAHSGNQEVSLLRSFTTDLNATLAMAILTIGMVQFYAIKELGLLGHLKHYFSSEPWKPVNLFIGINEVFGEFLRIVTLSMRLFGVIYAGEVLLITVGQLAGNFAWIATLPVMFLELFFCGVQAYIFMMLTSAYLAMSTSSDSHQPKGAAQKPQTQVELTAVSAN